MKTFTRILLLCLFPVLATGCEKEVITRYEQTGYNEYKFINNSSKDVFVAFESFDDGIRRDGFMIAKGGCHSVYKMYSDPYSDTNSPFFLYGSFSKYIDWLYFYTDELYVVFEPSPESPYYDAFYDSVYTENHITYHVYTITDDFFKDGRPVEELGDGIIIG